MLGKSLSRIRPSLNRVEIAVILFSSLAYIVQNLAIPIHEGRDFGTYFMYFRDMWSPAPEFPVNMLFRTPVAPLLFGALFSIGSWLLIAVYFWLSFVIVQMVLFGIARHWGLFPAILTVLLTSISNEFFRLFNSVASENPTTLFVALWIGLLFNYRTSKKTSTWALLALAGIFVVLIRSNHQVFLVVALLPFLNSSINLKERFKLAGAYFTIFVAGILTYSSYNYARYGAFEVGHLGPAHMPFYRLFIHEKAIRPDHGPASAELADVVREDILTRPAFEKYGIDEQLFFEGATPRFWIHIVDALNHRNGYEDNTAILARVSWELHSKYPLVYWFGYLDHLRALFEFPMRPSLRPKSTVYTDYDELWQKVTQRYRSEGLPIPSEKDLVEGGISQVTFQPEGHVFQRTAWVKSWDIPEKNSIYDVTRVMYLMGFFRPSIFTCILVSFIGLLLMREKARDFLFLSVLMAIVTLMLAATCFGNPEPQFRYPFDPFYMMLFSIGLNSIWNSVLSVWKESELTWKPSFFGK